MAAKLVAQSPLRRGPAAWPASAAWRAGVWKTRLTSCTPVACLLMSSKLLAGGDAAQSAAAVNRLMEDLIMQAPERYLLRGYNRYKGPPRRDS